MADMREFGTMNVDDRGGRHDYEYPDRRWDSATAGLTPSQTIGPFFAYGLSPGIYNYNFKEVHKAAMAGQEVAGRQIEIEGRVYDGKGVPVHDAMIELLQADSSGQYPRLSRNDGFTGYGRFGTGANGPEGDTRFRFRTIKPGSTLPGAAPFVTLIVSMRGLLNHFITRAYFPEDLHDSDPVMVQVPQNRQSTLVADLIAPNHYRFDIHMQGDKETVFFDL